MNKLLKFILLLTIPVILNAQINWLDLGNTYAGFYAKDQSEETKRMSNYSPLFGAMALKSGDIKDELESLSKNNLFGTLIQTIFHLIPGDSEVHISKNNGEVILSLTPKLMGQLLRALEDDKWESFLKDHKTEWHTNHKEKNLSGSDTKHFTENIKKIQKSYAAYCINETSRQKAREFFSALMILRSNSLEDIKDYLIGLGIESIEPQEINLKTIPTSTSDHYKFELEAIKLLLPKNPYNIKLVSDYGQSYFGYPVCGEMTLINFIGLLLYNPQSQKIDINYLTPAIQKTLNHDIIPLLEELFCKKNTDNAVIEKLVLLFSNVEGIKYEGGEKQVNFVPTLNSYTILLNHIFGTDAESFDKLIKKISNDKLSLSIEELKIGLNSQIDKIVKITKNDSSITVFLTGYTKHGYIKIQEDSQKIDFSEIKKLEILSKKVKSIKNILCLIEDQKLIYLLEEYKNLIFEINLKLNNKDEKGNPFLYDLIDTFSTSSYPLPLIDEYFNKNTLKIKTAIKENPLLIINLLEKQKEDISDYISIGQLGPLEHFLSIVDLFTSKFGDLILINKQDSDGNTIIFLLITIYSLIKETNYSSDKIFSLIKKLIEKFDTIIEIEKFKTLLTEEDELLIYLLSKQ